MSTASCLYEGTIRHLRTEPHRSFRHRLALAYVDLDELPTLLDGRLVSRSPGFVRFRREDYLGDPRTDLADAVRGHVERHTGVRPAGPVRVLTQLRSYGHCFNPVSFYYCFDEHEDRLEALLAEVTNTPWGERHAYVIPAGEGNFQKAFHVSPFMDMQHTYACRAPVPGRSLTVSIESRREGARAFEAGLALTRRELTPSSMRRLAARYPFATLRVLGLIYWHGVRLRMAGAPVFGHPGRVGA